jgi:ubiquinol-cytochrome c reductase iron-sulfur subunit
MAHDIAAGDVIHCRSPERPVRKGESARFDDIGSGAQACGKAQYRAHISGDIGLVKGDPHGRADRRMRRYAAIIGKWDWQSRSSGAISAPAAGDFAGGGACARGQSRFLPFSYSQAHESWQRKGFGMATLEHTETPGEEAGDGVRRRDFINLAAVSFAGAGAVTVLLPLINQMNPSADVLALASIEVDLSAIKEGQAIKTLFRKQPLFVRHLTAAEIGAADAVDPATLRDPATLEERTVDGKKQWLITMGVCTHLGCVPLGAGEGEPRGEFGGYFCPCHGSVYDTAARIRKGPAPKNLEVPKYAYKSDTVVQVG